jgi:CBS domain-containing protein
MPALELLFEEEHHTGYPVVKDGHLVGVVTLEDVRNLPDDARDRGREKIVKEIKELRFGSYSHATKYALKHLRDELENEKRKT